MYEIYFCHQITHIVWNPFVNACMWQSQETGNTDTDRTEVFLQKVMDDHMDKISKPIGLFQQCSLNMAAGNQELMDSGYFSRQIFKHF